MVLPDMESLCAGKEPSRRIILSSFRKSSKGDTIEEIKKIPSIIVTEPTQCEEAYGETYEEDSFCFEEFESFCYKYKDQNEKLGRSSGTELYSTRSYSETGKSSQVENYENSKGKATKFDEIKSLSKSTSKPNENKSSNKSSFRDKKHFSKLAKAENVTTKVENHFIDVGAMTFGGIFGLGEKMKHRVIMARTTVQCLVLPRFWLLEKGQNPGNVWQRRCFYLDHTIPSREELFKDYVATMKWQNFKKDLIDSNLDSKTKSNSTKLEDVPIICRITEEND